MKIMQVSKEELKKRKILFKAIGDIVCRHREAQNKSRYEIAAECTLSRSTWGDIETASCKEPALTTIWKIAEGLDIHPDELLREVREKLGDDFSLSGLN